MTRQSDFSEEEFREAENMARRVVEHRFGRPPDEIARETGGLSNFVFTARNAEGRFIVRIRPRGGAVDPFVKEKWAADRARAAGIPSTEVLEVGCDVIPHAYSIARKSDGTPATLHPERKEIVRQMGRYAALINAIPTRGFGERFDWTEAAPRPTWRSWLSQELKADAKIAFLESHGVLSAAEAGRVRAALDEPACDGQEPRLNHGDLRLKNIIVDGDGRIAAILDWDNCSSNLAPQWELSLALHDLSIDEKQDFIEAYGLSHSRMREIAPLVKALNIVNYAGQVEKLVRAGERDGLDQVRTRLGGALDLYSL